MSVFEKILAQAKEMPDFVEIEVHGIPDIKLKVKRVKDAFEGSRLAKAAEKWVEVTGMKALLPGQEELKSLWPTNLDKGDKATLLGVYYVLNLLDPKPTEIEVLRMLREAGPIVLDLISQVYAAASFTSLIAEEEELEEAKND